MPFGLSGFRDGALTHRPELRLASVNALKQYETKEEAAGPGTTATVLGQRIAASSMLRASESITVGSRSSKPNVFADADDSSPTVVDHRALSEQLPLLGLEFISAKDALVA